jgi:hypothetical protein
MDQPVRYYEIFARTVEVVAVLRFLTSIGTLGGKYHQSVYAISILLDMCISTLFVLAASISFICFVKARPAFQQSVGHFVVYQKALDIVDSPADSKSSASPQSFPMRFLFSDILSMPLPRLKRDIKSWGPAKPQIGCTGKPVEWFVWDGRWLPAF